MKHKIFLSKFGVPIKEWTKLKVIGKGKRITFYINDTLAYDLEYPDNPVGIVGLQYRFNGAGAVRNAVFSNRDSKIPL